MEFGEITWGAEKNQILRDTRGVGFEDVEAAIEEGNVLADVKHPDQEKYPRQRVLVVLIEDYAYNVPYVFTDEGIFLKTMFPSRRSQKTFLNADDHG